MQIYILYACKSDKKIKKLLIFFVLFGRLGFAADCILAAGGEAKTPKEIF